MRLKAIRSLCALAFLIILCVGTIWRFDVANRSIEFDEGLFLYTADRIARGEAKYTEDFDNMPPGIYYLYILSFALFGNTPIAAHMVSVLSEVGILVLLFAIGYLLRGPCAAFASAGFYAGSFVMIQWAPKGSTENPMTLLLLISLFFLLLGSGRIAGQRGLLLVLSGVFFALAFLVKQPAIFFALTVLSVLGYPALREKRWDMLFADLLRFAFGAVAVCAGAAAWLAWDGILSAAVENAFVFPMVAQREYGMSFSERWDEFVRFGLFMMPMVFALGVGGIAVQLRNPGESRFVPAAYVFPVLLYLAWTGDFFDHYLIQLTPGLALAAGLLTADGLEGEKRFLLRIVLICAIFTFAAGNFKRLDDAYITEREPHDRSRVFPTYWLRTIRDQQLDYQLMVGKFLRTHLAPEEKMISSTPTFCYLAGRPNAYSQFYIAPLTKAASDDFADLDQALMQARFFVIEGWRSNYLPPDLRRKIKEEWRLIRWIGEEAPMDVEVWENPEFVKKRGSGPP